MAADSPQQGIGAPSLGSRLASLVPARLAPVLAVVGLVSFSTATLGPVFPIYLTSLGLTPASIGLISSTFFVALAVGEGSWGWLGQRLGLRRSLVFGGALSGLAVLALAFTAQPAAIYALSAVRGAAFAAIFPATRSHVALAAPARRRAATIAVLGMAMAGTQSLGALLGGLVADAWGFRAVFVASALLAGVATGVALVGLRGVSAGDTPQASSNRLMKSGSPEGRSPFGRGTGGVPQVQLPPSRRGRGRGGWFAGLFQQPARGEAAAADPPARMPWRALVLQGSLAACFFVALGTSGTFLPVLAGPVQGLRPGQVGLIFTLSGLVGMLLTVPLGHLSDRMGRERGMALGLLASAGSMASLAFALGFWPLLAASSLGRLSYGLFSPAGTARLSEVVPRQRLTAAMGLYGLAEDVGVIAGPAIGGAVWGPWGHRGTFLLAALAGLSGLALMPWLARPRRRAAP